MSSFRNGQALLQSVLLLFILGGTTAYFTISTVNSVNLAKKKKEDLQFKAQIDSGIETLLIAYRFAEIKYNTHLKSQSCAVANPFLQALRDGSGCSNDTFQPVTVFIGSNAGTPDLYSYGKGCTIAKTSSETTCASGLENVITIGIDPNAPSQTINGAKYRFNIVTVAPERSIVEFTGLIESEDTSRTLKRAFAVRPILANSAHMEYDGRVTQKNPDPLARCQGSAWATFKLFNPANQECEAFVQLGGGTGLAFYKDRYFGFRPADGQVIDMIAANSGNSYLVDQFGKVGGKPVFPPYSKEALINTDDITLIRDQIYFVRGNGTDVEIGALKNNGDRVRVCDLGAQGWAMQTTGLAALAWSDPLLKERAGATLTSDRTAIFFIKTTSGDMLTAVVTTDSQATAFDCTVFKDINLQEIENSRTYGFDRTNNSKPYFVY